MSPVSICSPPRDDFAKSQTSRASFSPSRSYRLEDTESYAVDSSSPSTALIDTPIPKPVPLSKASTPFEFTIKFSP